MAEDPPIIELAFTLTFEALPGLTVLDLASLFNEKFVADYPTLQHAPPAAPVTLPTISLPSVSMMTGLELPRLWFISEDTHDLVQFQVERVSQNWRRVQPLDGHIEYPGYEAVKGKFADSFQRVMKWLAGRGISNLPLQNAELAYINAIPLNPPGGPRRLSEILTVYRSSEERIPIHGFAMGWWESMEEIGGAVRFDAGITALPDTQPALSAHFAGRCGMQGLDLAQALARFDVMHEKINQMFRRIMTQEIVASAASTAT